MRIRRLAAFSEGASGGNPAGVVLTDELPEAAVMQATAAEVGYSETVFAAPEGDAWRVRYFAPEREVPFCGHATIALGAALAEARGAGQYQLILNDTTIRVTGRLRDGGAEATLISPPTEARDLAAEARAAALALFDLTEADLLPDLPPALCWSGNLHLILPLRSRARLAAMAYDFEAGQQLMRAQNWVTVALIWQESGDLFYVRNAFAWGGVTEDPATGSAAAAIGGWLLRQGLLPEGGMELRQGQDMGMPCSLLVRATGQEDRMEVSGSVRPLV